MTLMMMEWMGMAAVAMAAIAVPVVVAVPDGEVDLATGMGEEVETVALICLAVSVG